jgi:hypothetical protein
MTTEQSVLLGLVASVVIFAVKAYAERTGKQAPREIVTACLFVVSVALAYVWGQPALPPLPVPTGDLAVDAQAYLLFVSSLIAAGLAVLGGAEVLYNFLLKRVYESFRQV